MLSATPMDMPPPPPRSVEVVVIDGSTFQLLVLPPQRDGGRVDAAFTCTLRCIGLRLLQGREALAEHRRGDASGVGEYRQRVRDAVLRP